jgi:hypothetical protein
VQGNIGGVQGEASRQAGKGPPISIAAALLVAGFVRFLVFVFGKMPLFAVVLVFSAIRLAFAHTLLVSLVFRIIAVLLLVLEKGSGYRRQDGPANEKGRQNQGRDVVFKLRSHKRVVSFVFSEARA